MKSFFIALAIMVAVAAFIFLSRNPALSENSVLERTAKEMNLSLPKQMDSITRLDSVKVKGDNALSYNYTLSQDGERVILDRLDQRKKIMLAKVCATMPEFKKMGTTLYYNYKNTAGTNITNIVIKMTECKN